MLNQTKTFRINYTTREATGVDHKSSVKFLGMTLDPHLTWKPQMKDTAKNLLRQLKELLSDSSLITLPSKVWHSIP